MPLSPEEVRGIDSLISDSLAQKDSPSTSETGPSFFDEGQVEHGFQSAKRDQSVQGLRRVKKGKKCHSSSEFCKLDVLKEAISIEILLCAKKRKNTSSSV